MEQIKVELQEFMGSDRGIANSAWTSSYDYQKKQERSEEDVAKVVNMLADSKHSVPFESVIFKFWIKLPIAIDRQLMTHRIASHSGMSGRYRTMPSEYFSIPDDIADILGKCIEGSFVADYRRLCEESNKEYQNFVKRIREAEKLNRITNPEFKRLREFFRGMLPQHNMTERVTLMNLRSWANFYKLRSKKDAQPEIQHIAKLMREQIESKNICPIAFSALERNNWSI